MSQASNSRLAFTAHGDTVDILREELNQALAIIANLLDQDAGVRGTPTVYTAMNFRGNRAMQVGEPQADDDAEIRGRSLRRPGPGEPFSANNEVITKLADPRAPDHAVNLRTLEKRVGKGELSVSTAIPEQIDAGDTGDAGSGTAVSAGNHQHGLNTGDTGDLIAIAVTADGGVSLSIPRADHRHALGKPFEVIPTASLPAAGAGEDGRVAIEWTGATLNLVCYGQGTRARLAGIVF